MFWLTLANLLGAIFNLKVVERGFAVISFRTLRWLSAKLDSEVSNEMVAAMELEYYGEERYAKVFRDYRTGPFRAASRKPVNPPDEAESDSRD